MSVANKRTRVRVIVISSMVVISLCLFLLSPVAGRMSQNRLVRLIAAFWNVDLFRAASSGNLNALRKLLDGGANPNLRDHNGESVLAYAASAGHPEAVSVLISYGAEVDAEFDDDRRTPLGVAAYRGYTEVVRVLLDHGANLERGAPGGNGTPLMLAASGGYVEIVRLLLNAGAKARAIDSFGKAAKDCALNSLENPHVIKLLLQQADERRLRLGGNEPRSEEEVREALSQIISLLSQAEKTDKNPQ